jgi:hypothetical protein
VITLRTPSLRQSDAGKSRVFETQISIFSPTARSVNSSKSAPPVLKLISGQKRVVPSGGLSAAAAAPKRAARVLAAGTGLEVGTATLPSATWTTSPNVSAAGAVAGTARAATASVSTRAALLTACPPGSRRRRASERAAGWGLSVLGKSRNAKTVGMLRRNYESCGFAIRR